MPHSARPLHWHPQPPHRPTCAVLADGAAWATLAKRACAPDHEAVCPGPCGCSAHPCNAPVLDNRNRSRARPGSNRLAARKMRRHLARAPRRTTAEQQSFGGPADHCAGGRARQGGVPGTTAASAQLQRGRAAGEVHGVHSCGRGNGRSLPAGCQRGGKAERRLGSSARKAAAFQVVVRWNAAGATSAASGRVGRQRAWARCARVRVVVVARAAGNST